MLFNCSDKIDNNQMSIEMNHQNLQENLNPPMPQEEMKQKGREARKKAKDLQRRLVTESDPEVRKQMSREMDRLFCEARYWTEKAKLTHALERSIEREFLSMGAEMYDK